MSWNTGVRGENVLSGQDDSLACCWLPVLKSTGEKQEKCQRAHPCKRELGNSLHFTDSLRASHRLAANKCPPIKSVQQSRADKMVGGLQLDMESLACGSALSSPYLWRSGITLMWPVHASLVFVDPSGVWTFIMHWLRCCYRRTHHNGHKPSYSGGTSQHCPTENAYEYVAGAVRRRTVTDCSLTSSRHCVLWSN